MLKYVVGYRYVCFVHIVMCYFVLHRKYTQYFGNGQILSQNFSATDCSNTQTAAQSYSVACTIYCYRSIIFRLFIVEISRSGRNID